MGTRTKGTKMISFSHYNWTNGLIGELDRKYPSYLSAWTSALVLNRNDTHFIYAHEDKALLEWDNKQFTLYPGMYASVPGHARLIGGQGIVVSRENWLGFFHIGGPTEQEGRLKYIDGCTDSLLVPPVKMGDPCLNLLYFPDGIDQTAHTHPSDRIGMIMSGKGRCHAWNDGVEEVIDLVPGMIFCIHTDGPHKFSTPYGQHMRVLAYHPDSDFGPTDQSHPMINRTIVDGVPASLLPDIQTK
jgi:mannose-6-phosphate isomerase-like protein (cupin superfamily)